ncbi:unnamed protein product [Notodromas monacha]|uniref:Uncharacterized protein n=1 Tax=Notodromas monacha TaxID=399045 RepID=A0A7R9BIC3_9CRUS|nr:unnamed protein product [Notodromas monacha]CAG0914658.1 unnamed protein product [Notodromas monacha]
MSEEAGQESQLRRRTSITLPPQWLSGATSAPKVVFITGASSGLGLALVQKFFEAGYKVIASCRNPDDSSALGQFLKENGLHSAVPMCVGDLDSVKAAYLATRELTSSIDILINNAGVLNFNHSPYDPVMEISASEMMDVYRVNVAGCLNVTQVFMPLVQASYRHPTILNISSPLGSLGLNQGGYLAPYRCSKAALNMLTKTFASEMPSVIFLAVAPRQWDHVPRDAISLASYGSYCGGLGRQAGEIKQDLRYHEEAEGQDSLGCAAAQGIVELVAKHKKEISGSFVYTDGELVGF